jgi:hypothetical protein
LVSHKSIAFGCAAQVGLGGLLFRFVLKDKWISHMHHVIVGAQEKVAHEPEDWVD